jgi:hypothetical protein
LTTALRKYEAKLELEADGGGRLLRSNVAKEATVAPPSNNDKLPERPNNTRAKRRERRVSQSQPTPAEVAAEAAAIYPDTFDSPPTAEEIAAEAYGIYQARGGEHGRDEEDWYEAERRVTARRRR